jgi:hypothetical protein
MVAANPLVRFSAYSLVQVEKVNAVGDEILRQLPDLTRVGGTMNAAYGSFWLWILGAHEILRTMVQAGDCFSDAAHGKLKTLKADLRTLRVPFAKQEMPGRPVPIAAEASIAGIGPDQDDLIFIVGKRRISAKAIIREFRKTLSGLRPEDVLKDHRQSSAFPRGQAQAPARPR